MSHEPPTVVVGGGFGGLAAAYELVRHGEPCCLLEASPELGGLAGTFEFDGVRLEKFYHHWFNHDRAILDLIADLGLQDRVTVNPGDVGMYYANSVFRLRSPLDLLRLGAVPLVDRVRTGLMALRARRIRDWQALDQITAAEWLVQHGGRRAFEVIWEPLLRGKFGKYADQVSAIWIGNKLKLRGSSRSKSGRDELLYYQGGFGALADALAADLRMKGVEIRLARPVTRVLTEQGHVTGVRIADGVIPARRVIVTTPLPIALRLVPDLPEAYRQPAEQIDHLASVCLILVLERSLSQSYWLNVNDPRFPFVAVIEHTRFDDPANYNGAHVVYLSRYTTTDDAMYAMSSDQLRDACVPYLKRMFPDFQPDWVRLHFSWRAEYTQPIVTRGYTKLIPDHKTPIAGLWFCTMAQIWPEDRGTNYAVSYARQMVREMLDAETG